ncbi:hypothetical protein D3C85_1315540 [compost metagenome]
MVIGGLEGAGADQPLATRLLEHVFKLAGAVGRVDVDQDHADLGAGELADAPLCAVRRPDAQAIAGFQPQRHQRPGMQVDAGGQRLPGVALLLMTYHQCLALGKA